MMRRLAPIAALSPVLLVALALAAPAPVQSASTTQGVYTEAQAAAGAELYGAVCATCHGKMLEGTYEIPALRGRFMGNWGRAPISSLFDYVSTAMPQMAPGSLSAEDNAKIIAFLLKSNGMPAGTKALPASAEALKAISFDPAGAAK